MKKYLLFFLLLACTESNENLGEKGRKIARVHDTFLYENEISSLHSSNISKEDSIALAEKYVKAWIREQLLLKEAEESENDFQEIDRRAKDYRDQLILYEIGRAHV